MFETLKTSKDQHWSQQHRKLLLGTSVLIVVIILTTLLGTKNKNNDLIKAGDLSAARILISFSDQLAVQGLPGNSGLQELQTLRERLQMQPDNVELASQFAEQALKTFRTNGEPRYLGYARSAITTWWDDTSPPEEIWLLRGRILQTNHEFIAAAKDLSRFIKQHHGNTEALLLLADAYRRSGNINLAKHSCLNLAVNGNSLLAKLCAIEVRLSLGEYKMALKHSELLISEVKALPKNERDWAYAVLAEIATANEKHEIAIEYYELTEISAESNLVTKLNYADSLIALERYSEAKVLFENNSSSVAVLQRLARIEKGEQKNSASLKIPKHNLSNELFKRLHDPVLDADDYLREKAIYYSYLDLKPQKALHFARLNWKSQKAWEDTELLLLTSKAVGEKEYSESKQEIEAWRSQWQTALFSTK